MLLKGIILKNFSDSNDSISSKNTEVNDKNNNNIDSSKLQ